MCAGLHLILILKKREKFGNGMIDKLELINYFQTFGEFGAEDK